MCRADVQDTAHPAGRAQGDCRRVQKEHTAPDEEGKVKSTDFQVNNMGERMEADKDVTSV